MTSEWRSNVSLSRETAHVLSERIFSGRYLPGEKLAQNQLSTQLGVSRTPLREALRVLAQDGLVQLDEAGRASVTMMDFAHLREACAFREAIEARACRTLCAQPGAETVAELELLLVQQQLTTGARYRSTVARFHVLVLEASSNRYSQQFVSLVRMTEEVMMPAYGLNAAPDDQSVKAHAGIIEALRASKPEAAEHHVREYFSRQIDLINHCERQSQ